MIAIVNVLNGVSYPSDKALIIFEQKLKNREPISIHISKKSSNIKYSKIEDKMVIENTDYMIIYGEILAYYKKYNPQNTIVYMTDNKNKRENKDLNYYTRIIKKSKDIVSILSKIHSPYIYSRKSHAEYLLILDGKPFKPLSFRYDAFMKDKNEIAKSFEEVFPDAINKS